MPFNRPEWNAKVSTCNAGSHGSGFFVSSKSQTIIRMWWNVVHEMKQIDDEK